MLKILGDILIAGIVTFLGVLVALGRTGVQKFSYKKLLVWWGFAMTVFVIVRYLIL